MSYTGLWLGKRHANKRPCRLNSCVGERYLLICQRCGGHWAEKPWSDKDYGIIYAERTRCPFHDVETLEIIGQFGRFYCVICAQEKRHIIPAQDDDEKFRNV